MVAPVTEISCCVLFRVFALLKNNKTCQVSNLDCFNRTYKLSLIKTQNRNNFLSRTNFNQCKREREREERGREIERDLIFDAVAKFQLKFDSIYKEREREEERKEKREACIKLKNIYRERQRQKQRVGERERDRRSSER